MGVGVRLVDGSVRLQVAEGVVGVDRWRMSVWWMCVGLGTYVRLVRG